MMGAAWITPETVEHVVRGVLQSEVACKTAGDRLQLDTPFTLQDGRLLRVFLTPLASKGALRASDGGYATSQIEIFTRSDATLRERYAELRRIARELELDWETEFSFTAPDLEGAAQRIPVLARAVDRALCLVQARPRRVPAPLRARLEMQLREAGIAVYPNAWLMPRPGGPKVRVDLHLRRNGAEAAVEVLAGATAGGAAKAVDSAVTNFHLLARAEYRGSLFAVYDEESPAGERRFIQRFLSAKPEQAVLLPGSEAVPAIIRRLGR